ncbi:zona pellucida protein AX 4 [Neoarius graeffei]|uniref:zona pellucida protein AX 4 n=1 Tax=Neoarius graeffei TaxID=443677 RepID=UPI00298C3CF1|nr:zona pellucida protein AX 4 [Neoarius graeffei]
MQPDGSINDYPFILHCSLVGSWSLREIVCEENYMETLEERAKQLRTGQVIFYRPDDFDKTPRLIEDVKAIGYHIVATDTRLLLRSAYSSLLSYTIKSHVLQGQYAQSLSVEFFYMYDWDDAIWPHTQHRSFLLLRTPHVPRTLIILNNTDPSTGVFFVTLGVFPADVSLQNITLGSETMSWKEAQHTIHLKQILFSNGSHAYELQVPSSHPMVTQRVISGHYKRHSLTLTFDLVISPEEEYFSYRTNVMFDQKEPALPAVLWGGCTERGVMVIVHYGSGDVQWELYVGDHRLDGTLVQLGRYRLDGGDDHFSIEIPLNSPGIVYEDLNLKSMVVKVEVRAVNMVTMKMEHSLVQRCTFPIRDFLVCLPEGRMVVVIDTTRSIPPTKPNSTSLLDPSCKPTATDSSRALFNFSLDSCGTTMTVEGNYLLYENEIRYNEKLLPKEDPLIRIDSPFRLTLQCRYPLNGTSSLAHYPTASTIIKHPSLPRKRRQGFNWTKPLIRGLRIPKGLKGS